MRLSTAQIRHNGPQPCASDSQSRSAYFQDFCFSAFVMQPGQIRSGVSSVQKQLVRVHMVLQGPKYGKDVRRRFFLVFECFFGGNYSQIANLGSRTYCTTFWIVFEISIFVHQICPPDTLLITETHQKRQEKIPNHFKTILFHISQHQKFNISKVLETTGHHTIERAFYV